MRTLTLIALFALLATPSLVHGAPADDLAASLRAAAGKEAQFVQKFTPKGFKNEQIERGRVVFGAPPMMRWSYERPEKKLFVFDGSTSWLYLPDEKQVTVHALAESDRQQLPFVLLTDPARLTQRYTVGEKRSGNDRVVTLTPRDASSPLRQIIATRTQGGMISRLEYTDRQGNRTVFEFSSFAPSAASADLFRFTPPAGVEVIRN